MIKYLRLLKIIISQGNSSFSISPKNGFDFEFTVMPTEIDLNLHLNNASYNHLMDVGRIGLFVSIPFIKSIIKSHWRPVLGGISIFYLRPLKAFQKYKLNTRLVFIDEKWFYFEQSIWNAKGKMMTIAISKGGVSKNGYLINTEVIKNNLPNKGHSVSNVKNEYLKNFLLSEHNLIKQIKR